MACRTLRGDMTPDCSRLLEQSRAADRRYQRALERWEDGKIPRAFTPNEYTQHVEALRIKRNAIDKKLMDRGC